MDLRETFINAIYGQESGHGKADTSKENYAGARGPMQVTKTTFDGMKANGMIPADYVHSNPEHTMEAGRKLAGSLYDQYDGNVNAAAAAYYAGPKAVNKDGSIKDYRDLVNPTAPTAVQYAASVARRMGVAGPTPAAAKGIVVPEFGELAAESLLATASLPKAKKGKLSTVMALAYPETLEPTKTPLAQQIATQQAADITETKRKEDLSFLGDLVPAAYQTSTTGWLVRQFTKEDFEDQAVPGYRPAEDSLAGTTEAERSHLLKARSPEEESYLRSEMEQHRQAEKTQSEFGLGANLLAGTLVDAPLDVASGLVVMRGFGMAKVGAEVLARQGRVGAAFASAAAENVAGSAIVTTARLGSDSFYTTQDYGMELAGAAILGTGFSVPGLRRAGKEGAELRELNRLHEQSATASAEIRAKALANLPENATEAAVAAEVKRLDAESIKSVQTRGTADLPADRRLLDNVDDEAEKIELARAEAETAAAKLAPADAELKVPNDTTSVEDRLLNAGKAAPDTRSAASILDTIAAGADKVAATLAERLRMHLGGNDISVHRVPESDLGHIAKDKDGKADWKGVYLNGPNEIALNARHADDAYLNLHEISHALSVTRLYAGEQGLDPRLSVLYKDIEGLRVQAKDKLDKLVSEGKMSKGKADYYLSNPREFVAGLYSGDSQFVNLLKGITVAGGNVFTEFVAKVAKLLGITEKAEVDAFTKMLSNADELMSVPLNVTRKDGSSADFAPGAPKAWLTQDPTANANGMALLPVATPLQEAEAKAMLSLWKKAEEANVQVDEKRLSWLMNTAIFKGAQSTANTMLRSKNPVMRHAAAMLLESSSGAAGRNGSSASIAKHLNEQAYLANTLNEVQDHFVQYRNARGGNVAGDVWDGRMKKQFDDEVAAEIEGRLPGRTAAQTSPEAKAAANSLEQAYERMRLAQINAKTIGWGNLPGNSKGYMPHRMDHEKLGQMSVEQRGVLHTALVDQFVNNLGFDITFSDRLAAKYMDTIRTRAFGGFEPAVGMHTPGAADIVEEAMQAAGMTANEIRVWKNKFQKGGAGHTKSRLQLDLNQEHTLADGSMFQLRSVFVTDQTALLRAQASRVSGEVALARQGVYGSAGLKLLRKTMEFGDQAQLATKEEMEAFDQVAAEFMGDKFGTQNRMMDRAVTMTSVLRLGGMGFQQLGEAVNAVWSIGAARTLSAVGGIARLRKEIKTLAAGGKVDNPILGSIEKVSGVDFGTESYKTVFPFDNKSIEHQTYGQETLALGDRLLRGASHVQSKLSFWRTIHSTQQRGMAEQIVRKAAEYIKDGKTDTALHDMGLNPGLVARLRTHIDAMTTWEGSKLANFDLTKCPDLGAAEEFVQAIHRGTSQIIQGTYIGETGKWAHDSTMRMLTQFRTFGLTAVEKQWGRQVGNHGVAGALGMMLGSMSMVAPIYMARTYLASAGRDNRQEYLDQQLAFDRIARASLNYVAQAGLAGDLYDVLSATTGVGGPDAGKYGAKGTDFVSQVVAPAAGVANDIYKAVQNTGEGTDPHQLVKSLPFSKLPYLVPAINSLGN